MFSGIIETLGTIIKLTLENGCMHLVIRPHMIFDDLKIGDSLALNGVCLTITQLINEEIYLTLVPETLQVTTLKFLKAGDEVNLERALQIGARLGGHFVQGHVDATGEIKKIEKQGDAWLVTITAPKKIMKYLINKGFITLDGMSITLIDVFQDCFTVTFIPHTLAVTKTHLYEVGNLVNLEVDMMSKYIEKLIGEKTT